MSFWLTSGSANAVILTATNANIKTVFATAQDGDTIVLDGVFGRTNLANRSFTNGLTIDARSASFNGQLTMKSVAGVAVLGGLYGMSPGIWQNGWTAVISNSSRVSFTNPNVVGAGIGKELGLRFVLSSDVLVEGGSFDGLRVGIAIDTVTNGLVTNNLITNSTSDGMNIVNSHDVTASSNICRDGTPSVGAHPDCIQMWSLAGQPMQSDIQLLNNQAYGPTQGFTAFNPSEASGQRISIIGNWVETSFPQGIACYGCFDSVITDNTLITLPGSRWRTFLRVPGGANNIVENNSIGPLPTGTSAALGDDDTTLDLQAFSARFAEPFGAVNTVGGVPEPSVWMQLLLGFGCAGALLRQRRAIA